jgi:hypothetical protein
VLRVDVRDRTAALAATLRQRLAALEAAHVKAQAQ